MMRIQPTSHVIATVKSKVTVLNGRKTHLSNVTLQTLGDNFCESRILLSEHRKVLDDRSRIDIELGKAIGVITTEGNRIVVVDRRRWGDRWLLILVLISTMSNGLRKLGVRRLSVTVLRRIERHGGRTYVRLVRRPVAQQDGTGKQKRYWDSRR